MAINFDLNDLLAFRAVAELSNFRKAAESVHLSQPAFSRRIDKLEQALGVRLLERTTRRVTLTTVGRDFERKVRELLDDLDSTLLGIRGVAATRMGEVTVACVPSTVYYYLSEVIRRYHALSPEGARQGARCGRQRGARRGQPWRGRLRNQLHGRAGGRPRLQAAGRGALRRGMSPRSPAGEAQARQLGPTGASTTTSR